MTKSRKNIIWIVVLSLCVALLFAEIIIGKSAVALCSFLIACIMSVPFFMSFESKSTATGRLTLTAVMIALTVAGRIIFAPLPSFKPVTAMVVIAGVALGSEAGFLTGSLSAVISNFYFGNGAWTPFQMLIWGFIGLLAGALSKHLEQNRLAFSIYGIVAGVVFSLFMDLFSTLWYDGYINLTRYLALVATSLSMTIIYAVSNVIFLNALLKPMVKKIRRIRVKYGI